MPIDYSKFDNLVDSDDEQDMPSFFTKAAAKACPNGIVHSPTDVDDAAAKGLEVATFALG